jgi:hypothetical protein
MLQATQCNYNNLRMDVDVCWAKIRREDGKCMMVDESAAKMACGVKTLASGMWC